ncbi:MAG TPA: HAD-IIIC family phosphatase [Candidatus Limnocylindria bacterium]|jgi:FkbH-like protein|nr:HAD-IIIC family phosphatase [Candidatus Limnocylindria bacterium]
MNTRAELAAAVAIPSVAAYLDAARALRDGRYDLGPLRPLRLAIARAFTVELLLPYLSVECALAGVRVEAHVGQFGTYRQEILDPASSLFASEPDVVLLAIGAQDLVPTLVSDFLLRSPDEVAAARDDAIADLRSLAEAFRASSSATLLIHTVPPPTFPAAGAADRRLRPGQRETFELLNQGIARIADQVPGVEVFDLAAHIAGAGQLCWEDPRFDLLARAPFAAKHLPGLARAYARVLALIAGVRRKCVVVDLDNTLWGGVVGEDGCEGIELGADYPGAAFSAFQRALLDLRQRGVLIAIASKNEDADVQRAFDRADMLLKREHVASWRVDWRDKATSVAEIAAELGLGLDAIVFIDDDPTERALMSRMLPEVLVPDWPREPADFVQALHAIPSLDTLRVTGEDRERAELYRTEVRREEHRRHSASIEDFLRSLELRAAVARVGPATVARAAQLTQRTNQFNLTLRRYSESEIAALASSPDHEVFVLSLRDRFGDAGRVALGIVAYTEKAARIEALLMSCRVLGRGVESFLLAHLAAAAWSRGATVLEGSYMPGPRNAQVSDFYGRHGFVSDASSPHRWSLDLREGGPEAPSWITAEEPSEVIA